VILHEILIEPTILHSARVIARTRGWRRR
jgi:hypothetical protein